jgi:hypothetical protein
MPNFNQTVNPTSFGFFDEDPAFQVEADAMVTFVKRMLGDDVLSVELSKKEIWTCLEQATLEYSRMVQELKIISQLANVLGQPTGSTDLTNRYLQQNLDFLYRLSDAYAQAAYVGGNYDYVLGFTALVPGKQDYNLYTDFHATTNYDPRGGNLTGPDLGLIVDTLPEGLKGKLRVMEVFHFEPLAAQTFLLNASNITNFLATNFNYESYVNSTVFYVLPVFEDVVRRGMLKEAFRVRRSNYSYEVVGSNIRIYPQPQSYDQFDGTIPGGYGLGNLYVRFYTPTSVLEPDFQDDSIYGVSGPENVPFSILPYSTITVPGRQWIRQYALALSREVLGLNRNKFKVIPIPNADLQLNGAELIEQGRADQEKLMTNLKEFLEKLTYEKLLESQANIAEAMQKMLKYIAVPHGKAIIFG